MDLRNRRRDLLLISLIILLINILLIVCISKAKAHDWYDKDCCSNKDCKPVRDGIVTETHEGVRVRGYGVMPENDKRLRWSKDELDHICVFTPHGFSGGGPKEQLLCVYRKRKIM